MRQRTNSGERFRRGNASAVQRQTQRRAGHACGPPGANRKARPVVQALRNAIREPEPQEHGHGLSGSGPNLRIGLTRRRGHDRVHARVQCFFVFDRNRNRNRIGPERRRRPHPILIMDRHATPDEVI